MTAAFIFDARFCSGCKACQAACKDKNSLPPGVLWRRVIEVSGGAWEPMGAAWDNTVFAYNLSISCNHCVYPKCAGVCPTGAYTARQDGVVLLDPSKCMGCGYCAWACPYGAPQYDPQAGRMTKCDLCLDRLEQGLPPVCAAACPMRALEYGEATPPEAWPLWELRSELHPYPLPSYSHTQPRLAVRPHAAMRRTDEKRVANREEIQPRLPSRLEDLPLLLFTLLAQTAVGGFWAASWAWNSGPPGALLLPIGLLFGAGLLASLAHLGTKRNAWRALGNLRKSSLSREVLFAGLFGLGWLLTLIDALIGPGESFELTALTAVLGLGLVHNIAQVYRFPAAPAWNTWRTNAGFLLSALLLGHALIVPVLALTSGPTRIVSGVVVALLAAQMVVMGKRAAGSRLHSLRLGLLVASLMLAALALLPLPLDTMALSVLLFLFVALEETLGRWLFYLERCSPGSV